MTETEPAAGTIHASAVLVGSRAILVRGPSGAGKSRLVFALIEAGRIGQVAFARLVADDRAEIEARHGRLLVRPVNTLAGLLEVRGIGICRLPYEPVALVGAVVDLGEVNAARLPPAPPQTASLHGVELPRLAVAPGIDPIPLVLTALGISGAQVQPLC